MFFWGKDGKGECTPGGGSAPLPQKISVLFEPSASIHQCLLAGKSFLCRLFIATGSNLGEGALGCVFVCGDVLWNVESVASCREIFRLCFMHYHVSVMCPYLAAEYNTTVVLPMTRNDVCYLCSTTSSGENVMLFTQEVQPV